MKKLHLLAIAMLMFIASCTTTKVERETYNGFKGDWTLSQATTDMGKSVMLSNLFGKASLECLEGSTWHLVANNNKGHYTLDGAGCDTTENEIKWFVQEEDGKTYFWFKNIEEGTKAKNNLSGYKMQIVSVDDTQAHLMQEVPFEGNKITIHYYFNKQ